MSESIIICKNIKVCIHSKESYFAKKIDISFEDLQESCFMLGGTLKAHYWSPPSYKILEKKFHATPIKKIQMFAINPRGIAFLL